MSTRKVAQKNIRKLTTVGQTSLSVTIPKEFVVALGWKDKQKVVVKKAGGAIIVRDWKRR